MLSVLSAADAVVVGALVASIPAAIASVNAWQTRKQMRPNGGSSLRDAVDRIESAVAAHHTDLLDVKADVRSAHDRLRDVEAALRRAQANRHDIAAENIAARPVVDL